MRNRERNSFAGGTAGRQNPATLLTFRAVLRPLWVYIMVLLIRRSCPRRPRATGRAGVAGITVAIALAWNVAQAGPVNTAIYSNYTDNFPSGVHFTGTPVDNISTPDFDQFGAAVSWRWHPDALKTFAADTLGY